MSTAWAEDPAGVPWPKRVQAGLGNLFPVPPGPRPAPGRSAVLGAVVQLGSVAAGAAVLLERVPGRPPWDTLYGEDFWEFLLQAVQRPWHLFIPYHGYEQLVPRVIAQVALYLPLAWASWLFAVAGAVIAAACGLFVYHAIAGHVRSTAFRVLLGAAVVLLPIAPMEIADSGVNTVWYLLIGVFWALLWRPRARGGRAVAALVAFAAAASNGVVIMLAPLVALRLFVLRRPLDHVVSAAWLAGCLLQAPAIVSSGLSGQSRLDSAPAAPHQALAFYAHDVVLPSLGWHLAWGLRNLAGKNDATAIVGLLLVVVFGAVLLTQARNRPFLITALATGFVLPVIGVTVTPWLAAERVFPDIEPGARYTALPIFLLECAAVVAADHPWHRRAAAPGRPRAVPGAVIAAAVLVAVFGANWAADFRYPGYRSERAWAWSPVAAQWQRGCARSGSGMVREWIPVPGDFQELPCASMRFQRPWPAEPGPGPRSRARMSRRQMSTVQPSSRSIRSGGPKARSAARNWAFPAPGSVSRKSAVPADGSYHVVLTSQPAGRLTVPFPTAAVRTFTRFPESTVTILASQ